MDLRLLVVDDNADFLQAARDVLQTEGISIVAVASNGGEALERCAELHPDAVLVDVDLGDESGLDVAIGLVQSSGDDGPAVVLISTYGEQDVRELVDTSPAVGFLSKADLSGPAIRAILAVQEPQ
jgi:CheY-like chemotaxis protein